MMLAIYFVLAWSLVGCIAALLMGRAIAICSGGQQAEMAEAGDFAAARPATTTKALTAAKAA